MCAHQTIIRNKQLIIELKRIRSVMLISVLFCLGRSLSIRYMFVQTSSHKICLVFVGNTANLHYATKSSNARRKPQDCCCCFLDKLYCIHYKSEQVARKHSSKYLSLLVVDNFTVKATGFQKKHIINLPPSSSTATQAH